MMEKGVDDSSKESCADQLRVLLLKIRLSLSHWDKRSSHTNSKYYRNLYGNFLVSEFAKLPEIFQKRKGQR